MVMHLQRQMLAKPRRSDVKIATKIATQTQIPNRSNAAVLVDQTCFHQLEEETPGNSPFMPLK